MRRLGLAALLWCLAGCTQWHFELGQPIAELGNDAPHRGMLLAEVMDRLGPPLHISAASTGYVMAWEYWYIQENSLGLSLGLLGADFLNIDWGAMHASGEYLLISFDRAHTLTSVNRSSWHGEAGAGMALQPFASVLPVVDSGDLRDPLPQHTWGASLQQRLPRSLNRASNLEESNNGLQRRGTTNSLGQHSLDTSR